MDLQTNRAGSHDTGSSSYLSRRCRLSVRAVKAPTLSVVAVGEFCSRLAKGTEVWPSLAPASSLSSYRRMGFPLKTWDLERSAAHFIFPDLTFLQRIEMDEAMAKSYSATWEFPFPGKDWSNPAARRRPFSHCPDENLHFTTIGRELALTRLRAGSMNGAVVLYFATSDKGLELPCACSGGTSGAGLNPHIGLLHSRGWRGSRCNVDGWAQDGGPRGKANSKR